MRRVEIRGMNTDRAKEILGWMSLQEVDWLAEQASKRSQVVEIGSYLGRSTRALADNTCGRVYAIDTWKNADRHPFGPPPVLCEEDWCWQGFLRNVRDLIPEKLEVRRRKSIDAAFELYREGKRFDMIFIDGSHEYGDVVSDIVVWEPLLAPGGLICGHDFTAKHPGVYEAVRNAYSGRFKVYDTIWYAA
jgi:predicted O-methyltransferase YrrM